MSNVRRPPPPDRRGTNLSPGTCASCGKLIYPSRRAAKAKGRQLYPGVLMRAYRCGGSWHLTSQDGAAAVRYRGYRAR